MKGDPTFWLLARASGLTAYVLATLSVLAGLVLKSKPFARLRPAAVTGFHRSLAAGMLGAVALHGVALVLDTTVRITPLALLLPGLSAYRPVSTALGVAAAELAAVIYASFSLRRRLGFTNWRRLHWLTYAVFGAATIHGLTAGTDASRPWARLLYIGAIAFVVFATAWRALVPPARPRRSPIAQGGTP